MGHACGGHGARPLKRTVSEQKGYRMTCHRASPRRLSLSLLTLLALIALVAMACGTGTSTILAALPTPTGTPAFHVLSSDGSEAVLAADANNTSGDHVTINWGASWFWLLQATHFWGTTVLGKPANGIYNDHPLGVEWIKSGKGEAWAIFNEDQAPMPIGARFFVKFTGSGLDRWGHFSILQRATATNIQSDSTIIDDPHTNGQPTAKLFVTSNFNPPTPKSGTSVLAGVSDPHPIGVYYLGGKWAIFNEDHAPMPVGAAFNVMVDLGGATHTIVQTATPAATVGNGVVITDPSYNSYSPMFLTPIWYPGKLPALTGGGGGVYNPHNTGVYFTSQGQWAIFNEDQAPMPIGAAFQVGVL